MSFTYTSPKTALIPAENLYWTKVQSSEAGQSGYKYTYSLYEGVVGSGSYSLIGEFRSSPSPDGTSKFSPNSVLKYELSVPASPLSAIGGLSNTTGYKEAKIIYGSESATGGTKTLASGTLFRVFGGALAPDEYLTFGGTAYEIHSGGTALFLTDRTKTRQTIPHDTLTILGGVPSAGTIIGVDKTCSNQTDLAFQWSSYGWNIRPNPVQGNNILWSYSIGDGVYIDNNQYPFVYSDILFPPSVTADDARIWTGETYDIEIETSVSSYNPNGDSTLTLWGIPFGSSNWVYIEDFGASIDEFGFLTWIVQGTVSQDWNQLGVSYSGNCPGGSATFGQPLSIVKAWNYTRITKPAKWRIRPQGDTTTYFFNTVEYGKLNQMNVGYTGLLETGVFDHGLALPYLVDVVADDTTTVLSETLTYTEADCKKDAVSLTWLNSLGGYDTYEFNMKASETLGVARTTAQTPLGSDYTSSSRGLVNLANVGKTSKTVITNWIGETETNDLAGLTLSPSVYEVQSDGSIIPVVIDTASFAYYTKGDRLKQTEFVYSLSQTKRSQSI